MAREKGVTYVKLDGEVGILGNGAGLVMSTLDVVAQVGGRPANFFDVGGGGEAEEIVDALEVITVRPEGARRSCSTSSAGITRCDEVARGILDALGRLEIERADRRAARRHQRRGGPAAAGRGRAARPPRRAHDARRRRRAVELAERGA